MITKFKIFENKEDLRLYNYTVKCNNCDWYGSEDDLKIEVKDEYLLGMNIGELRVCPNCVTDNYLMDVENIEDPNFYEYVKDNEPKEGVDFDDFINPADYFKEAYPEYFAAKQYNL